MEQKQRLFIYDRREVFTLVALGLMVAAFAFTLGVHLGKRVVKSNLAETTAEVSQVPTLQDSVPNKQELKEQSEGNQVAADDTLTQSLHNEVTKSGVKLKAPRQVELPTKTKSENAGATTLEGSPQVAKAEPVAKTAPSGAKYTLQIGSYPTQEEAKEQVDSLRAHGLSPFLRQAQVKGLGTRYRLFVGGFSTREAAEKSGLQYKDQNLIHSYLVSNLGDEPGQK